MVGRTCSSTEIWEGEAVSTDVARRALRETEEGLTDGNRLCSEISGERRTADDDVTDGGNAT